MTCPNCGQEKPKDYPCCIDPRFLIRPPKGNPSNSNTPSKELERTFRRILLDFQYAHFRTITDEQRILEALGELKELLKQEYERGQEDAAHPTDEEWCCACEADVAFMTGRMEQEYQRGRLDEAAAQRELVRVRKENKDGNRWTREL